MTNQAEKKKPAAEIRDGAIKAAIWPNSSEKGVFYSVTITRTYKNGDEFKDANSFSGTDLLKASRILALAYDQVRDLEAADREAAQAE